jgi:hypothetical protein
MFDRAGLDISTIQRAVKHLPLAVGKEVQASDGTASRILIRDTWNTEILHTPGVIAAGRYERQYVRIVQPLHDRTH